MLLYSRIWRPWNEGPLFSIYMNKSSVKPLQEILRTPANSRASFLALMPKIFKTLAAVPPSLWRPPEEGLRN